MTIHDEHPEVTEAHEEAETTTPMTDDQTTLAEPSKAPVGPSAAQTESTIPEGGSAVPETERSDVGTDAGRHAEAESPVVADAAPSQTDADPEISLFAEDELAGLRARWDNVQAAFVDDPRDCVQKADGLVSDVVGQLTTSFTDARSRLEERWGRGEEASTEDLRIALKRYRAFFERLLAV